MRLYTLLKKVMGTKPERAEPDRSGETLNGGREVRKGGVAKPKGRDPAP